jgi:hypothetical protein
MRSWPTRRKPKRSPREASAGQSPCALPLTSARARVRSTSYPTTPNSPRLTCQGRHPPAAKRSCRADLRRWSDRLRALGSPLSSGSTPSSRPGIGCRNWSSWPVVTRSSDGRASLRARRIGVPWRASIRKSSCLVSAASTCLAASRSGSHSTRRISSRAPAHGATASCGPSTARPTYRGQGRDLLTVSKYWPQSWLDVPTYGPHLCVISGSRP